MIRINSYINSYIFSIIQKFGKIQMEGFIMSRNAMKEENIFSFVHCKNVAHMAQEISIAVLSDNGAAEHFARRDHEIAKNMAGSYPSIIFARGLFQRRLVIEFSSSSNVHWIRIFRWALQVLRRVPEAFLVSQLNGFLGLTVPESRLSIRIVYVFFFAYDLLMHVQTRGVLHDTSSQLTSPVFAVVAFFKNDRQSLRRPKKWRLNLFSISNSIWIIKTFSYDFLEEKKETYRWKFQVCIMRSAREMHE